MPALAMAFFRPSSGSSGVVGAFSIEKSPVLSFRTTISVKVPPVSTERRTLFESGTSDPSRGNWLTGFSVDTGVRLIGYLCALVKGAPLGYRCCSAALVNLSAHARHVFGDRSTRPPEMPGAPEIAGAQTEQRVAQRLLSEARPQCIAQHAGRQGPQSEANEIGEEEDDRD